MIVNIVFLTNSFCHDIYFGYGNNYGFVRKNYERELHEIGQAAASFTDALSTVIASILTVTGPGFLSRTLKRFLVTHPSTIL